MTRWLFLLLGVTALGLCAAEPPVLQISVPTLHEFEDGPKVPGNHVFRPGEHINVSFRVTGYQQRERDRERDIRLSYTIEAIDPEGVRFDEMITNKVSETILADKDKDWTPRIRAAFFLPPLGISGEHEIRIRVKDELSGKEASQTLKIPVQGKDIQLSDQLSLQNFRFLRSEQDAKGLEIAAYRTGETLWARFDLAGYKRGEANQMHVAFGLEILSANRDKLFEMPQAAEHQESPEYPKRYVPNSFNLSLEGTERGEYILVIKARDLLGNQDVSQEHKFRVE